MPTYDYECQHCQHLFEEFHSMSETPDVLCPECHKSGAKKKIGAGSGVIFKGSGFYTTDYRKDSPKSDAKQDS